MTIALFRLPAMRGKPKAKPLRAELPSEAVKPYRHKCGKPRNKPDRCAGLKISLMPLLRGGIGKSTEDAEMTTIIKDTFATGAAVSMEMDKDEGELFVFYCPAGQGCKVSKWPLDSYHMPIAMAHYTECCELEAKCLSEAV